MVVKIKNRHRLKSKEVKDLISELKTRFHDDFFSEDSSVDIGTLEDYTVLLVDDAIDFVKHENNIVFTLQGLARYHPKDFFVVVDMGAIGFITKGADVMGPGITGADPAIQPGDYVWVSDEKYRKPLVVGIALVSGEEMNMKKPGKTIKTIHYVGDRLWTLSHE